MNVTYLTPISQKPVGGIKVIYQHAEALRRLGLSSFIFQPENPEFRPGWFSAEVSYRSQIEMDKTKDFLIIPEVWALKFAQILDTRSYQYAIFVQGGYLIYEPIRKNELAKPELLNASHKRLIDVYRRAEFILSISEDTSSIIELAIPGIDPTKIIRLIPGIKEIFRPSSRKEN
jgi:hypothetical protein